MYRLEEGVERAEAQLYAAIVDQNIPRVEGFQVRRVLTLRGGGYPGEESAHSQGV